MGESDKLSERELLEAAAKPPPREDQLCALCREPFRFGPKGDPLANVWTVDGKKEVAISGTCERCFDEACDDRDD